MLKKLFLSHYHDDAAEVAPLARALRLRGVVPWVDKDGGFSVADHSMMEARRAIREDCFGLCLYATRSVFTRPFIRDVEMDEAKTVRATNPAYLLFAIPRGIDFTTLSRLSRQHFLIDLGNFHTAPIKNDVDVVPGVERVAGEITEKVLGRAAGSNPPDRIALQYSTRERMPDAPDDVLCIDATAFFTDTAGKPDEWSQLLTALRDTKRSLAKTWGRPRLSLHGSKHLSAAFLFGRVFAPFEMDIRQAPTEIWRTDESAHSEAPFSVHIQNQPVQNSILFVEVASGNKDVSGAVNAFISLGGTQPSVRLILRPSAPLNVDNALCVAMAQQAYREIERIMELRHITEIHLFAAAPQAFLMMLGRRFSGMPPVFLYEWEKGAYVLSATEPGGIL